GDGVSDVDITRLLAFHDEQQALATVTIIQPAGRYGSVEVDGERVKSFHEKQDGDGQWFSGGFFVCNPKVIDYIDDDTTIWEREPLERLVAKNQLAVWKHRGFWAAMDTVRDKHYLEDLWSNNKAPWKSW
ncbi:MAG TPA: glucose-1-phosphate cytidylyltransferase, partial [Planctomycetes bacterium]|nr:glucose-1-phosphate cytidylyltransferase [Planctomycetota bacterium]